MPIRFMHVGTALRTLSYAMLAKGIIAGAFMALTLCGVSASLFGYDLTRASEGAAVSVGGIAGLILALRA